MKTSKTLIIILSIFAVIMISGCLTSKHYDANGISFNYPSSWQAGVVYDLPGALVEVSESSQVDVKIFKKNISNNSSLETIYNESLTNHTRKLDKYCYQQISSKNIIVDGVPAYETIYQLGCNSSQTRQKIREIWLEKNGYIYIISCIAIPPEIYPNKSKDFDMIINSLHIK
jgi:hypothetical protein